MTASIPNEKIDAWINDDKTEESKILLARAYYQGIQPIHLTDRQKEFLDLHSDNQFCLNLIRTIVNTLRDDMEVSGFQTNEEGEKKQAAWFWEIWNKNKIDTRQGTLHETVFRDREAFVILDWDDVNKIPSMIFHERYTSPKANAWEGLWTGLQKETSDAMTGTGEGIFCIYENNDIDQKMIAAVKQWYETMENGSRRERRTVYYDDRIERFYKGATDWLELEENAIKPWKTKDNKPIGIPVIHFYNQGMLPEAWDGIPPQDVINKTWVDVLGESDLIGFGMLVVLGLYPTTDGKEPEEDGSNVWKMGPAEIIGNRNAKAGESSVDMMQGSDPTPLMETLKDQIVFLAHVTNTPVSNFILTAQVSSADTLKEQDKKFRKKVRNRQVLLSDPWEQLMYMARRIQNVFGAGEMDEEVAIETIWRNISTPDDVMQEAGAGIPQETLWVKLGYTEEQIAVMKKSPSYRIQLMKSFWEAYAVASQNGVTVEGFAKSVNLSVDDVKLITESIGVDTIPPTGL